MQQITGTLLFYAIAIYLTILVALGTIEAAQTSGTTETEKLIHKLPNYCAAHPDATLRYKDRNMILRAHSDELYFSESQARRRAG